MLKNKTAVITGCNKGIGKSTIEVFSKNNCNVIACVRKKDKEFLNYCKDLQNKFSNKIEIYEFDFQKKEEVSNKAKEIIKQNTDIDILINNAGVIKTSLFQMTKISSFEEIYEINFFNQLLFTQIIIKNMVKKKIGNIVFLSSSSAFEANLGRGAYSSSKSSIITLSKNLSIELARFNIRVNSVAPGLTKTDMMYGSTPENFIQETINRTSLKRIAEPKEISNVLLFLASDLSSFITGQVIRVDGGLNG